MRDKHPEAGVRPRGEKRKDDTMLKKSLSLLLAGALTVSLAVPAVAGNSQAQPKKDTSYGTTYYLDSTIGKTDGDGLTPANAFDSLEDINAKTFQPGDQILIKAGTQYTGTLWPKGSGCEGYPIVIDMYGEGDKPLIDGNGAYFMPQVKDWQGPFTGETGDQIGAAVYLYNQEYIEINNLEVKNQGDEVDYTNNIWYFTNSAVASRKDCFYPGANSSFDNNVYIGCVAPTDPNQHTDDPQFVGGSNLFGLTRDQALVNASLTANSPYVGAGVAVEDNGGQDILGGSLDTLNLGAIAGAGHQAAAVSQTYTPNEVMVPQPQGPVETYALQYVYDYAIQQDTSNLIPSVAAFYQEALTEAKAVLDGPDATQLEVDAACGKLMRAVHMLNWVRGDKAMLELLIIRADQMVEHADLYVTDNWQQLLDALDQAKKVYDDENAMDSDIQPVVDQLLAAILAQRYKASRAILEDLVAKAEDMDLTGYTAESVAAFRTALDQAKAVLAQESNQAAVEAAVTALNDAMANLTQQTVDKEALSELYTYAGQQDTSNLIPSVAVFYQEAMTEAKAVLDDATATQLEVDAACGKLMRAVLKLDWVKGDKAMLEVLIARAEGMVENVDKYVSDNWQQLVDALAKAKEVFADENAMDVDIEPVVDQLLNAILAQRYQADKSVLEDLLNQAEGMDLTGYTAESVAVFRSALQSAQAVMADETLSEEDQATVDAAVAALNDAMDGLTADGAPEVTDKPEATDQPEASQTPEATDKPETTQTPEATDKPEASQSPETTDQPQSTAKPQATQKPESVPQTGDSSQLLVYVAALASAVLLLSTAVVVRKQTRR